VTQIVGHAARAPHASRAAMPIAVIFDLDGVIIDSEELQYNAYSKVLARFGVRVSIDEYAEHWIAAGHGPEYAVRTYALPMPPDELRALKNPVYHEILRNEVRLMPGVMEALQRLHRRCPLAVATNSNRQDTSFVVDHFAIRRFFTAIVTREDYPRAKPNPDAFTTAAAEVGMPPASCVVIEDAPKGVLAAHRAGAAVLAVPNEFTRGNDFSRAAAVLGSLDELTVPLLETVAAQHAAGASLPRARAAAVRT
jgi:HAD superfamily hydrolase (TIGR01509 family)